jgi:hypothetical protein
MVPEGFGIRTRATTSTMNVLERIGVIDMFQHVRAIESLQTVSREICAHSVIRSASN